MGRGLRDAISGARPEGADKATRGINLQGPQGDAMEKKGIMIGAGGLSHDVKSMAEKALAILLAAMVICVSICGCAGGGRSKAIDAIATRLEGIHGQSRDISDALQNEDLTGRKYVDEEDRAALGELITSLEEVGEEIDSLGDAGGKDDILMLRGARVALEMADNAAYSYIALRDAPLETPDDLTILAQNNYDYILLARGWIDILTGKKKAPCTHELYGLLFMGYLRCAMGNWLLNYYWIDEDFFGLRDDLLQELTCLYDGNLQRLRREVEDLEVAEDLGVVKDQLLKILELMEEQNNTLRGMAWSVQDVGIIDMMDGEIRNLIEEFGILLDDAGLEGIHG